MKRLFFFSLSSWKRASARLLGNNGVVDGSPLLCAPLPVFILAVFLKAFKPGAYPKHSFESLNLSLFSGPLPSFSPSLRSSPLLIRRELFFFFSPPQKEENKQKKKKEDTFQHLKKTNKLNIMRGCCQCFSGGVSPHKPVSPLFFPSLASGDVAVKEKKK